MADLARNARRFDAVNADLVVIGSGDSEHFDRFREVTGYKGLLFSDPELLSFSILGFSRGVAGFVSLTSVSNAVSAFREGHRQGAVQGSVMQLGGAVVVDTSDVARYYFAGRKAGEHPDINRLLRAAEDSQSG